MKRNLLSTILSSTLVAGSVFTLGACLFDSGETSDAALYHLTLSSNLTLSEQQKSELKATYGYGEPSATVKEGIRPQEDIEELKQAGATDADIEKAGKRQADGSYYFFEQDPMYIEAPSIEGYYLDGFFYKDSGTLAYRPILSKGEDQSEYTLQRWNMDAKDVELVATYKECRYHPYFNDMWDGDTNPNILPDSYSFIKDGDFPLLPATTVNKHKHFVTWAYSKYVLDEWTTFEIDALPHNYDEDSLRIESVWECDKFAINFEFDYEIEYGNREARSWEDVCDKIMIKGNLTTVNGESTIQDVAGGGEGVEVQPTSEILTPYIAEDNGNPWIEISITPKEGYKLWNYAVVDGEVDNRFTDYELGYFLLHGSDFSKDNSTVKLTFVLDN